MELALARVERLSVSSDRGGDLNPIDAARFFDPSPNPAGGAIIDDIMFELFNRRTGMFADKYESRAAELRDIVAMTDREARVDAIWTFFDDRVDRASLYLHALMPDEFVLYRKLDVEQAIFESLEVLSAGYPDELEFEFSAVPLKGREAYDKLNDGLQRFSRRLWPDDRARYLKLVLFLYWVLPEVTRPLSTLRRYWVGMAKADNNRDEIHSLSAGAATSWSATYQVEKGDYYLMYCADPVKSVAAIFEAADRSRCDPVGAWKAHWVDIKKVADGHVPIVEMRTDPVLRDWGPVKRNFQGLVLEQVPPVVFNRLRELFVEDGMEPGLVEEAVVGDFYGAGEFASERDFEEEQIRPLLREMGFGESRYQQRVEFHVGSGRHVCWIDFLVRDERGRAISLFEDKKAIKTYRHATSAYLQGRSYALQLGLRSFVVAAPEGVSFYARSRSEREFPKADAFLFSATWPELDEAAARDELKRQILRFAPRDGE